MIEEKNKKIEETKEKINKRNINKLNPKKVPVINEQILEGDNLALFS